jgi:heme exporter protein D
VSFDSWQDFLYMGGHYPFVWSSYAIGVLGIVITLVRPLRARRRFFAEQAQQLRRQSNTSQVNSQSNNPSKNAEKADASGSS